MKSAWAVALALSGCVGNIGDSSTTEGSPSGPIGRSGDPKMAGGVKLQPDPGCASSNPGHVTVHRLNKVELNNTLHDLLGDTSHPADELPPDDGAGGFDNNAAALNVDRDLIVQYEGISRRLAQKHLPTLLTCKPATPADRQGCARQVLEPLAKRAWRRPPEAVEIDRLINLVEAAQLDAGNDFAKGMEMAVEMILLSPSFLFRIEYPPTPETASPYSLDAYSLASRLSYFLWSSMPDEQLFAVASSGKLLDSQELASQVTRMLADAKAKALADSLGGQWLLGRKVDTASRPINKFPSYDTALRTSVKEEVSRFVGAFVQENLDLRKMLDADFTFLNDRLAKHYKITGVTGAAYQKVPLPNSDQRGGLLTQAAFLIATSNNEEPSIPRRGVTVLRNLLCTVPPPAPPDAMTRQSSIEQGLGANPTRRQVTEARDDLPTCGGCHKNFDPIGLALDKYDAVGAWRESDDMKRPINIRVEWNGGLATGPKTLERLIKSDARLPGCMTAALFRYALGRTVADGDQCMLDQVTKRTTERGFLAQDVIAELITSNAFRFQSPE